MAKGGNRTNTSLSPQAKRTYRKRLQGKTVRQIAAEDHISPRTVITQTRKVEEIVGVDVAEFRRKLLQDLHKDFYEAVSDGLKFRDQYGCPSPAIVNGFGKGTRIYQERVEVDNPSARMSDAELSAAIRKIFGVES